MSTVITKVAPHDVAPERESTALAAVDRAIGAVSGRHVSTRNEATSLLEQVQSAVRDDALRVAITAIVNEAFLGYRNDRLLDTWRIVDPLLDIRLVLDRARLTDEENG